LHGDGAGAGENLDFLSALPCATANRRCALGVRRRVRRARSIGSADARTARCIADRAELLFAGQSHGADAHRLAASAANRPTTCLPGTSRISALIPRRLVFQHGARPICAPVARWTTSPGGSTRRAAASISCCWLNGFDRTGAWPNARGRLSRPYPVTNKKGTLRRVSAAATSSTGRPCRLPSSRAASNALLSIVSSASLTDPVDASMRPGVAECRHSSSRADGS
jgi:hypothetical protein